MNNTLEIKPILAIVANKAHKYEYKEVSYEEGKNFADEIGSFFQESSKFSNYGINELFKSIGKTYFMSGFDYKKIIDDIKEEKLEKKKENKNEEKKCSIKGMKISEKKLIIINRVNNAL